MFLASLVLQILAQPHNDLLNFQKNKHPVLFQHAARPRTPTSTTPPFHTLAPTSTQLTLPILGSASNSIYSSIYTTIMSAFPLFLVLGGSFATPTPHTVQFQQNGRCLTATGFKERADLVVGSCAETANAAWVIGPDSIGNPQIASYGNEEQCINDLDVSCAEGNRLVSVLGRNRAVQPT